MNRSLILPQGLMYDPAQMYEECKAVRIECEKVVAQNAKLRSLLEKAANHIDALGDPMSAVMIREAIR